MAGLFSPFDPDHDPKPRRFRPVPIRILIPNLMTILAICVGLTAIRMGIEGRMELAVYAVVIAAFLDGLDGRLARMLKGTSRFGAELDSLCDFVNFGVVPAVLLYIYTLTDLGSFGWAGAIVFAVAAALRLARFNVALDAPKPDYAQDFFVGVPAPVGALLVMLPIYLGHLGTLNLPALTATASLIYCVFIALLMVSKFPTWSFKKSASRVPREMVVPVIFVTVLLGAVLVSYTFEFLMVGVFLYLALMPVAFMSYQRQARAYGASIAPEQAPDAPQPVPEEGEDRSDARLH
ncbi:CDP-diacylglycerol--serine O-phosphatidyltransferase [Terrihabitans soli]|uniref:CDP-diacylglycerol--serine O-phosphatidyltransferase n=1 Tax=Terrihabitans soli TaxID=708113 RepID=A0A6S6QM36_9HYPH|nr:phosphatidylcholine/phosphatidylserine synthase [Terrihabitans soli]BCJ90416.1 CDP-diacylglycerol--serine O-phosphatidyltransferase [Terrihabitans soli]